jgi:hypothetical protein
MENLHPEYAALSGVILNIIIAICKAHGIDIDASTEGDLTVLIMWLVIRVSRRIDPPATKDLEKQITKNIDAGK